MKNSVLILDFGSQYTKLIARRVRELKIYSEIMPFNVNIEKIKNFQPGAIILSGGPSSVYVKNSPKIEPDILELGIPILGICYGLQLIAYLFNMKVEPTKNREYGLANLEIVRTSKLLKNIKNNSKIWMSHGDKISQYPKDFIVTGKTKNTEISVIESNKRNIFGVQFHPEVAHTQEGKKIIYNFLFEISNLKPDWNMEDFIKSSILKIRKSVGTQKIILGLSGGVDSTVLALLLRKSIGNQLIPVFIDTGLLRKNEHKDLMNKFRNQLNLKVYGIDASKIFLKNLKKIRSPEKKKKNG